MTKHIYSIETYRLTVLGMIAAIAFAAGSASVCDAQDDHAGHDHAAHGNDAHMFKMDIETDDHDDHEAEEGHDSHVEEEADDHDDHEGHDHDAHAEEEEGLRLSAEQRKRFGIKVVPAGPGHLRSEISLPGEIVFNEDKVVHMVPRMSGIAREVTRSVGDRIKAGDILAVIDSRELADAKSEYLAVKARQALAEKTFLREKKLHEKSISSEQDFLQAEQDNAEARISLRSAEQKLHALGLTEKDLGKLDDESDELITRYEIRSPINGVVTEKHIALGESLEADSDILTVVDASTVWGNLAVYTKNLGLVTRGQAVVIEVDHNGMKADGRIAMVTPFVNEVTRTASARVVLDNSNGRWIPGTFITGRITASSEDVKVVVQKDAIQVIEGRSIVFVEHEGAFEMAPIVTGRSDRDNVEILKGLDAGTAYVTDGAFELKATMITSNLDSHAGHGH